MYDVLAHIYVKNQQTWQPKSSPKKYKSSSEVIQFLQQFSLRICHFFETFQIVWNSDLLLLFFLTKIA